MTDSRSVPRTFAVLYVVYFLLALGAFVYSAVMWPETLPFVTIGLWVVIALPSSVVLLLKRMGWCRSFLPVANTEESK